MIGLALSGGGSAGAWSIGALTALIEDGVRFDVAAGVSVGAIQAAAYCMYKPEDDKLAVKFLQDEFLHLETQAIWRHHVPLRRLHGLWLRSFVSARPLRKKLESILDPTAIRLSGKQLRIGAMSTQGEYKIFDEHEPHLVDAVLASAAFPGAFAPVSVGGTEYIDGGVIETTPIKALIAAGCTTIYAIICHPAKLELPEDRHITGLEQAMRAIDAMAHQIVSKDIEIAMMHSALAQMAPHATDKKPVEIKVIRASKKQTQNPLRFVPRESMAMFDDGYAEAHRGFILRDGALAAQRLTA